MLHYLPDSPYVHNRLTQSSDIEFWLTATEKQHLQEVARSHYHDPQPACPEQHEHNPFLALPWAYAQLQWLTTRLLDNDATEQQVAHWLPVCACWPTMHQTRHWLRASCYPIRTTPMPMPYMLPCWWHGWRNGWRYRMRLLSHWSAPR